MRTILIGGTSHAGKSTLGRSLAGRLGWSCVSTDTLARHPGRPWREPPDAPPAHVIDHYLTLSADALLASVLAHYEAMWPRIEGLAHPEWGPALPGLVIEGSAVLPAKLAGRREPGLRAVWILAPRDVLEARIRRESGYQARGPEQRRLIDSFLERAIRFDALVRADVERLGLPHLHSSRDADGELLAEQCLQLLREQGA
jgi:hypothetical protein